MGEIIPITELLKRRLQEGQPLFLVPGEEHIFEGYSEARAEHPFHYNWENAGDSRHQYFGLKIGSDKGGSIFLDQAESLEANLETLALALKPKIIVSPVQNREGVLFRQLWTPDTKYDAGYGYPFENGFSGAWKYATQLFLQMDFDSLPAEVYHHMQAFCDQNNTRLMVWEGDVMKVNQNNPYHPNTFSFLTAKGVQGDYVGVIILETVLSNPSSPTN